jgi:hydrogenase expression/formation protein HypC
MCLGVPGQVVAIQDETAELGVVLVSGVRRVVSLALVRARDARDARDATDEACSALIGTWVLIHVGFAMERIDEREAQRTLELLRELGEAAEAVCDASDVNADADRDSATAADGGRPS